VEDHLRPVLAEDLVDPLGSRMSATTTSSASIVADPHISSCRRWRFDSSWSSITSCSGPNPQTWRHSSLPMEPPAPVTEHALAGEHLGGGGLDDVHLGPADERSDLERAHVRADDLALQARPGTVEGGEA
jgi:hypothetical protein